MAAKKNINVKKKELEKRIKKAVPVIEVKKIPKPPSREFEAPEQKQEEFFVGLHNSIDVRRNILESSRDMIHTLQSYQKISEIRAEKFKRIEQFKTVMEELKLLTNKLNKALPKVQVKEVEIRAKETFDKKPRLSKADVLSKSSISDLEKLEEELSKIEGRLSRLD